MKYITFIFFIIIAEISLMGQDSNKFLEGEISYITSQSVYVKFKSTKSIQEGDTLFIRKNGKLLPALKVNNLSSISCVCTPLIELEFKTSDSVISKPKPVSPAAVEAISPTIIETIPLSFTENDSLSHSLDDTKSIKQKISGRVAVSSYSNFYGNKAPNSQRMRYTVSFLGKNLGDSKFSAESYLSFAHSNTKWEQVKENIFNGLKIYSLAAKYEFNENTRLLFGRKINSKLSSVGAIDGLQFEKQINSFTFGAIAGSRPDYLDYSFNFDLLQYGLYVSHEHTNEKLNIQSSMAIVEQTNHSFTDRRFIYFQHSNRLIKNVYFFGSAELDLYKKVADQQENTFNLTNLYLSLRYRIIKQLSLSLSFTNRNNIIYYETYKDIVERLLETEALQGWRFQINYRPIKYLSVGITAGYRYRKQDPRPTKNLYSYLTYSKIPGINVSGTLSFTVLETGYLSGNIYSIGLSRVLIPGKLNGGIKYRYIDYNFISAETDLAQNTAEFNLSWKIYKKLSMSVYYEGTFEKVYSYNRIYVNLTQRF